MSQYLGHNGDPSHLASGPGDPTEAAATEARRFRLTEAAVTDGCREIEVEGELDLAVADRLQQAITSCESDHVLVSLRSCQFIDSSGIAVIINANRGDSSRVLVHSPCGQVLRILELTGLTTHGIVFADREDALAAIGRPVQPDGDRLGDAATSR